MAFVMYRHLQNPQEIESSNLRLYTRDCKKYLLNRNTLVLFSLGTLTFMLLFGGILTYFSMYLSDRFGLSPMTIGMFLGGSSLITAGVASQAGKIAKSINPNRMLVFSFVLFAVSFLLIPFIPHVGLMMIPILCFGLGMGLNVPVIQDVAAGIAPAEYRGLMVSSLGTLIRLGQTLGPIVLGWVLWIGDLSLIFKVALIASLIVAVLLERAKIFSSIEVTRD
jgi:MFS family permease